MSPPRPSRWSGSRASSMTCFAAGTLIAGCASHPSPIPSPGAVPSVAPSCLIVADSAGTPRPVTAVFADSADGERAGRADSLEPPLRLDCDGRALPALATAWSRDSSGRFWTIQLASPADGTDGPRWTAVSLLAAWRASAPASEALRLSGVESLLPLDDRRIVVGFAAPRVSVPPLFADPALGIPRSRPRPTTLDARAPGGDLRDALDGGADLVVSDDPALLDYAGRRPGLTRVPLPWSRAYVLLVPAGSSLGSAVPPDTAGFRAGLARDAVRVDARPAARPFWWDEVGDCGRPPVSAVTRRSSAVAYAEGDASARALAERLVALAGAEALTARGLSADDLSAALRAGSERAYVVAVPSHALVPCRAVAGWPVDAAAVGLVETREHAIIRRGTPPLVVGWDGTLRSPDSAAARAPSS
jgi:hypothetical protein